MGLGNAYGNQYWPRKYLIDIDGISCMTTLASGYEETEAKVQELLTERMARLGEKDGMKKK